jgi:hypothetical protein
MTNSRFQLPQTAEVIAVCKIWPHILSTLLLGQAGVYLSRAWPFEVIVIAILLEQQNQLEILEQRLQALWAPPLP